jgi:phosphatidylglycerol---prolipoprotein diacylglyceryl transferase
VLPKWAEKYGLSEGIAARLYLVILFAGFLGARILHVLFEAPEIYRDDPLQLLFIGNGGLVYLGAVIFATLASWIYLKQQGEDILHWGDVFSPWMAFGYAVGRLGCFFNGCCYGKYCTLPWAVKFPSHMFVIEPFVQRHPTQIYAFLSEMVLFVGLMIWLTKSGPKLKSFKNTGLIFSFWIFGHGVFRLILEQLRDDDRGGLYFGWSISSLISLFMIGIGFWGFVYLRNKALEKN